MGEIEEAEKAYEDRRSELVKIRADSIDSLDKAIMQLSTGTLVVTITFLEKIGKPYDIITIWLLLLSWVCFVTVIGLNLLSFHFATKNMDFKIGDLDNRVKQWQTEWRDHEEDVSPYKKKTENCNKVVVWSFLVGIALFLTYAGLVQYKQYANFSKSKKEVIMSDTKKTYDGRTETSERTIVKRGATEAPEKVVIQRPPTTTNNQSGKKDE